MKLKSIFLLIICVVLAGCGSTKPSLPSAEKVKATLDKVIKKENPDADYTVTSTKFEENSGKHMSVEFTFKNFDFTDAADKKQSFYSGRAVASIPYKENGKWTISTIQVFEPEPTIIAPELPIE